MTNEYRKEDGKRTQGKEEKNMTQEQREQKKQQKNLEKITLREKSKNEKRLHITERNLYL